MKHFFRYIIAAVGLLAMAAPAMAQDYYDDIYGGPRKQSKAKTKKQQQQTPAYQVADYAPADSYAPSGSLQMDVDQYNRRGQFLVADSVAADSTEIGDTFAYTRRIERFHNPDIVTESGDTTLCDYYYSTPQQTNVNVYVVDNSPYYPYNWAWRYGNPWYWNVYGPSYVGWGGWYGGWYDPFWYDPYPWGWSWGWTWAPGWGGWGPGWGWGWGHGPGWGWGWGPSVAWRPSTPSAGQPHRPTGSGMNSGRGHGSQYAGNSVGRPGNMGRPSGGNGSVGTALRPGYSGTSSATTTARPGTRPNASQGTYTPYGAGTRGRNSSGVSTGGSTRYSSPSRNNSTSTPSRNSYNNNNTQRNNNSSSRSSYNSGSSRGSYGGGGGGSYGTRGGGGSHSGGGGGGRGRR